MAQLHEFLYSQQGVGRSRIFRDSDGRKYIIWEYDTGTNEMTLNYGIKGQNRVKVPILPHIHDKHLEDLTVEEFECLAKTGLNK